MTYLKKNEELIAQRCATCSLLKAATDFPKHRKNAQGRDGRCRLCMNIRRGQYPRTERRTSAQIKLKNFKWIEDNPDKYHRHQFKHRYKLTEEQYAEVIQKQSVGMCDSCGHISEKALHLDHDHVTKKYRGMLCQSCNHMLGMAQDNPERLIAGATYLGRFK